MPPGDLRMALSALCDDTEWGHTWRDLLQHRFASSGELHNHAVGNLLIVALWELLGDTVAGLDWVARLLGARGRVLPMAAVPLDIEATVVGADPQDRSRADDRPRPGRGRHHHRAGGRHPAAPGAAAGLPRGGRRGRGGGLGGARARVVVHQRPAAPARARPGRGAGAPPVPGGSWSSTWSRRPARPRGSRRRTISRSWRCTRRSCRSTSSWPTTGRSTVRSAGGRGVVTRRAAGAGRPGRRRRPDPARPAAPRGGVPGHHGLIRSRWPVDRTDRHRGPGLRGSDSVAGWPPWR